MCFQIRPKPNQAYVCPGECQKEKDTGVCCRDGHCDYADPPVEATEENKNV